MDKDFKRRRQAAIWTSRAAFKAEKQQVQRCLGQHFQECCQESAAAAETMGMDEEASRRGSEDLLYRALRLFQGPLLHQQYNGN